MISVFPFLLLSSIVLNEASCQYEATWESLESRPLPEWYDKAKVGIFLHWAIFSVPSFGNEWFWYEWKTNQKEEFINFMEQNYKPNFTYQEFAPEFTAQFFNPDQWADLFVKAGAKYVVLTSKHHEGWALWPSKYSYSWNSVDVGPHRDLVGDLAAAIKKTPLHFGLYHSLLEWYHPLYTQDRDNDYNTTIFVDSKITPEMYELVTTYEPEILWSDGAFEGPDYYWKSKEFLAWLYNNSPVKDFVVTNDRWGNNTLCEHGGVITCYDRYNPGVLQPRKWENAMTIDKVSWAYRRNANLSDFLTIEELVGTLAQTISCGGNILINVGPTKDGDIAPIYQERLLQLGSWLQINGEAIYESIPWTVQNDTLTSGVWYTADAGNSTVYAIVLNWPEDNVLNLASSISLFQDGEPEVSLLGNKELSYKVVTSDDGNVAAITFPDRATVVSDWAWVIKITS